MLRRLWIAVILIGLVATAGAWFAAFVVHATSSGAGFAAGAAHRDRWLATAIVYHDGEVFLRLFKPNPTIRAGIYFSRAAGVRPWSGGAMPAPNAYSSTRRIHLFIPSMLCAALSVHAIGWPIVRRRWRCKRNRCVACGYDLRQIDSKACPECGVSVN